MINQDMVLGEKMVSRDKGEQTEEVEKWFFDYQMVLNDFGLFQQNRANRTHGKMDLNLGLSQKLTQSGSQTDIMRNFVKKIYVPCGKSGVGLGYDSDLFRYNIKAAIHERNH